jgi:uncharacterized protein (TIGR03437 family)
MQQGDGVWLRNAYFGEAQTFDACVGHQPGNGQYHHHAAPTCLREQLGDNVERVRDRRTGPVYREKAAPWTHSPILGWAYDGYPIYGPYAYADPRDARSEVRRMRSGFRLRAIAQRATLPDWAMPYHASTPQQLTAAQQGPPVNATFPLGRYLEDYEWASGVGDLDQYNGRFAVTPEFPQGTYCYHTTIEADGSPAFPYIFAAQFYGSVTGGNAMNVPSGLSEGASMATASVPLVNSWFTRNAQQPAVAGSAFNPAAGPQSKWPFDVPEGARVTGGVSTPTNADVQRIRYSDSTVYINANGLPSYTLGPWFDVLQGGGIFSGMASAQNLQVQFPRSPAAATTRRNTALGAQGVWVNGVAVFNALDGSSYSNARGTDVGGGLVALAATHVSAASFEQGPLAPGSWVSAFPLFQLEFLSPQEAAVSVRDSAGTTRTATIGFASARQINYRLPADTAIGYATVNIASGGVTLTGNINVRASYPNVFMADGSARAAGSVARLRNGQQSTESLTQPIDLGPASDQVYLVLYGSGLGGSKSVTATIGGVAAEVIYAGAQPEYAGVDQFNLLIPRALAGRGRVDVVITAEGRKANAVNIEIR